MRYGTLIASFFQRKRVQLLDAARDGRSADILRLLSEGAGIECKDRVRLSPPAGFLYVCEMRPS